MNIPFTITLANGTSITLLAAGVQAARAEAEASGAQALGVYMANPTPMVSCAYGAPMGRPSTALDPDGRHKAKRVRLEDGYDAGGAYWGERLNRQHLYAVQDGVGGVRFVDATSAPDAISRALAA